MIGIAKDAELYVLLKNGKPSIRNSLIARINISLDNNEMVIEIDFHHLKKTIDSFRLIFKDIKEYSFAHTNKHGLYVEGFTLFNVDGLFYLSMDPEDDRASQISENDQDLILCGSIEGLLLNFDHH